MQRKHFRSDVFRAFASFQEEATLKKGDTVARPYRSKLKTVKHTRNSTFTAQQPGETEETLTVQESRLMAVYIDDLDLLQANYELRNRYADDSAVKLGNDIDGEILSATKYASSTVSMGDLGGTSGDGIAISPSNVKRIFTIAKRKLRKQNVSVDADLFAVVSPEFVQVLEETLADKQTGLGDSTSMNGHVGKYMGFQLYESNAVMNTKQLALATQPTNGDVLTIQVGEAMQTFTFVSSIGTTAGNVLIGANVDATRANLTSLINTPTVTSATQVALSTDNAAEFTKYATAANNDSTNVMTLEIRGAGYAAVTETLTDATDTWTTAKDVQHLLFGRKGAVDVVIQKDPNVQLKDVSNMTGANAVLWNLFGWKVFAEGAAELVDVCVLADGFSAPATA